MARHTQHTPRKRGRTVVAASFAVAGLAVTGAGVYAGLNAEATGTQAVTSGTLKLEVAAATGAAGFTQAITNMAPGDVENRFVALTNSGTLAGKLLTVSVGGTSNLLINDATKGLHLTVDSCSVAWVVLSNTCAGTTSTLLNDAAVSTLTSTTSGNLVSGAVAAGNVRNLRLSWKLPDQNETTTNGVVPTGIQGLTNSLAVTFTEAQRDATTVSS